MSPVESNQVPFEVIPDDTVSPRTGIEVAVYSKDDPTQIIDVVPRRLVPSFLEELNGPGGGSFNLHMRDKKLLESTNLLDERNICKLKLDQQVVGAFVIQKKHVVWADQGEAAGEQYQIQGEGLRTWFNDPTVYPYGGVKLNSPDARVFSFASEQGTWYNSADWVAPTKVAQYDMDPPPLNTSPWGTAPAEWPDAPSAWWVWNSTDALPGIGYCYFRYEFDIDVSVGTKPYSIFASADDQIDLYVDAGQVITVANEYTWSQTYRADFNLDPGHHIIAARVKNVRGRGGFIAALYRAGDATAPTPIPATLLSVTGDTGWVINAYPDPAPGWTPGEVMLTLLDEASARGVRMADILVPTFTATHDSEGALWDHSVDWSFDIGANYTAVVDKLEEVACDVWINPSNYELNMSAARGVHKDTQEPGLQPVQFQIGRNLKSAGEQSESNITNALIMRTKDGYMTFEDTGGSIASYGRVEGFVSSDASSTLAGDVAKSVFDRFSTPLKSATFEIIDVDDARPFVDFRVGDWTLAPGDAGQESRRVVSISFSEDAKNAMPIFAVEFDTISQDRTMQLEKWLKTTSDGTLGGMVANASVGGGSGSASPSGVPGKGQVGPTGVGLPGLYYQGIWNSATTYNVSDTVNWAGQYWVSKDTNTNQTPSGVSTHWDLLTVAPTTTPAIGITLGLSSTYSMPGGATAIPWSNEIYKSSITHITNGTDITIQDPGPYTISGKFANTSTGTAVRDYSVQLNGVEIMKCGTDGVQNSGVRGVADLPGKVFQLNVGDVIRVVSSGATTHILDSSTDTWISLVKNSGAQGEGGPAGPAVANYSKTTGSLANNATEAGTFAFSSAEAHAALVVAASAACRVRFYATTAQATADTSRAEGVAPTGNHGCLLEVILPLGGSLSATITLANQLFNQSAFGGAIPYVITNKQGSTGTVTVTVTAKGL